ncbi:putative transmembrane protein [Toxoplasma gondii RUB]|uniref:Putative transmembrane protein n=1 Tax=Toxoplasma gondii RUB TaxID=935652 RepID=A0A086LMS1_TOXGO|nr:putative transmembrane protein [Toxoplasma gondii RUB]
MHVSRAKQIPKCSTSICRYTNTNIHIYIHIYTYMYIYTYMRAVLTQVSQHKMHEGLRASGRQKRVEHLAEVVPSPKGFSRSIEAFSQPHAAACGVLLNPPLRRRTLPPCLSRSLAPSLSPSPPLSRPRFLPLPLSRSLAFSLSLHCLSGCLFRLTRLFVFLPTSRAPQSRAFSPLPLHAFLTCSLLPLFPRF